MVGPLNYARHEKLSLKAHAEFNEAWLHQRICEAPEILGLGDVRVIDRERTQAAGGRLDILMFDQENNRRYEVEVMLGATDPSHIVRTIEYWDIERRRYPGYDHVAVLIAEDVTTRFPNVLSLMSGSIPLIAIQLDAITFGQNILLNFVRVLDQTDLRLDDEGETAGGNPVDRGVWEQKVGAPMVQLCDEILRIINATSRQRWELSYMQQYIGLRANGVADNFIWFWFKKSRKVLHLGFRSSNPLQWKDRFEQEGIAVRSTSKRAFEVSLTCEEFKTNQPLLKEVVAATVAEFA